MSLRASRLFVSIQPSEPVRASLAELFDELARARWTPPHQLHLTLRFLGDVPDESRQEVETALAGVRVKPFFLAARGVGRFPPRGQPSVVWAGLEEHPHLHQLRQQVDDRLLTTSLRFELRPFVPHVTLARTGVCAKGAVDQWLRRHRDFEGPAWRVDAFQLVASELSSDGAEHTVVREFPLGA